MTNAVWFVAVFGVAATVAGLALRAASSLPLFERLHPRTRARALAWSAAIPLAIGALFLLAVFVPHTWLGLADHCDAHVGHLHLCLGCGLPTPPLALTLLASVYAAWVAVRLGRVTQQLVRAQRALRSLAATESADGELAVLPIAAPIAFVAGFASPRIYVSPETQSPQWSAVVAHERDHARHRDPLARLLARFATVVSPPVGGWLERRIVRAQELAADEAAARDVGDRLEVARQVVAWARRTRSVPGFALAFGHGDVTERVRLLLDAPRYLAGPSRTQLCAFVVGALLVIAPSAPSIHHAVDALVHLLEH